VGFGNEAGEINFDPFLWYKGRLTNLNSIGTLGGGGGSAYNVNDRGDTVGINYTADDSALHAVLWRDGTFTDLLTLAGDDCSQPYRINNVDQIVGSSFSCATFTGSAFIYEDGEMVDLNALIPADAGVQLQAASWINDDGVISAQAVLTGGSSAGDSRAVLLIPVGACAPRELQSAAVRVAAARLGSADAADGPKSRPVLLSASSMWRRPASPAQLRGAMHLPPSGGQGLER
jgi:probable HAF family extracellular repeat protein